MPSEAGENLNFTDCGSLQAFVNANYVNVSQFTCQTGSYPSTANCSTPTPVSPTPVSPTPVALTTYYGCCNNGAGVQGSYANSSAALTGLNAACDADEPGINNQVQGGVSTSPIAGCTPTPTPVAPTPVSPTPVSPTPVSPTPVSPTPVAPTPTPVNPCSGDISLLSPSQCTACGYYYSTEFGECVMSAPTPVSPTPVSPTPVSPTPVSPTPVSPTPVSPTPVSPTPITPTPTSPTPVSPTPVSPTPVSPTPVYDPYCGDGTVNCLGDFGSACGQCGS